jgi:hypothetical protein
MDGWRRMGLDDAFQIRQVLSLGLGFPPGLAGLGISIVDTMNMHPLNLSQIFNFHFFMVRVPYGEYLSSYLILDNSESPPFKFTFPEGTTWYADYNKFSRRD